MKAISNKQKAINKELKKVYKEIAEEREHKCTGCNRYDVPLSHSHLIPRSRRKDLTTNKKNITYHCLTFGSRMGCHDIWESKDRTMLLDYFNNMSIIEELDREYYNLLKQKEDANFS